MLQLKYPTLHVDKNNLEFGLFHKGVIQKSIGYKIK